MKQKQKKQTCLKHVKELFRLRVNWEYKNDPELQATAKSTHVRCHVVFCNKQPEMK